MSAAAYPDSDIHSGGFGGIAVSADDEYYHKLRQRSIRDSDFMEQYSEKPPPPPEKPKFYRNKKYWIICSVICAIITIVVVCLIVFVFFPMIAQSLMNQSGIDVNGADISFSSPLMKRDEVTTNLDIQRTFFMQMESTLTNTGPFGADIKFHNPITVFYNDTLLGNITLPKTSIGGGKGSLVADTPFSIQNSTFFAHFSKDMLALDTFSWNLKGKCDITALTRTATVNLDKSITLQGMGGFKNVTITSFQLPSDDPKGGIVVELGTIMNSPSPIGVQLGTIQLQIGYQNVNLGLVSASNVTLKKGDNAITLKGTIDPLTHPGDLEKVGTMFSTYVSGGTAQTSAVGVSAAPDGHTPIQWLSEAFTSVKLNVGLSNPGGPMKIIKAVNMGHLDLAFDPNNPYAPTVSAPNVVADFDIPFGFSLNIMQVTQKITMNTNTNGKFSELAVPWVASQSNQTSGKLNFGIHQGSLAALPGMNDAFTDYTYDLTSSDLYTFGISGMATTKTRTPIGDIVLGGIEFTVPTSLRGLQFLNSTPTVINSVDMTGGTSKALQLDIGVTMGNPSDFSMSVGDVTFAMFVDTTQVGTVTLANLTLERGDNKVVAKASFDPKASQEGQGMLTSFVMGKNSATSIGGFKGSTSIASLSKALGVIKIDTTLPGLSSLLIQGGALKVLPNSIETSIVNVVVSLANPFTAGLSITKVKSTATYQNMAVGNIDQDISKSPFAVGGHKTGLSPQLNMKMSLEPTTVAQLMRNLAVDSHLDTKALDGLLGLGGFHIQGQENVEPTVDLFKGFNISNYVLQAMKALKVDLNLESTLQVGDYVDDLAFSQNGVQITTDDSVIGLIPIVGKPIVQHIVNGALLGFETLVLSDPTDKSARVQMKGSITKTGPMAATIAFPAPLTVKWQGKNIGTATMPTLKATAGQGASFDVPSDFIITDQDAMQAFAAYMINNQDFVWDISSANVSVTALGFTFTGINMEKSVTLKGCNGFKGAVTIKAFDLPADDPAGGITLTADTTIANPSQVGFSLKSVAFNSYYQDVLVGPLAASPGNFPPSGTSSIAMKGRMVPQKTKHGLDMVGQVFENYLAAKNSLLTVVGDAANGPSGPVGWLTKAFKTLKIENVVLPGPKIKPTLIPSIIMENMQLDFTAKDPYAAPASSTDVRAQLKNPFGFPLGVSQLNMEVDAKTGGNKMAHLSIPTAKAITDKNSLVKTQFNNVPFKTYDDAHPVFAGFLTLLTKSSKGTFGLGGTSNALTTTAIGKLQLNGISFDVETSLAGFANFGGKSDILSLDIVGGTKDYILVKLAVSFVNPSHITITVGNINFLTKAKDGATVGQVFITDTVIKPGVNKYETEFHMMGSTSAIGKLVGDYTMNQKVPLQVSGTMSSTTIAPLQSAFKSVNLATTMSGIDAKLVAAIKVVTTPKDLIQKTSKSIVTLNNPFKTPYVLEKLQVKVAFSKGGGSPFQVAHIESIPGPCTVPANGQTTCSAWHTILDASMINLGKLMLAPNKNLDVQQSITARVGGDNGYLTTFEYSQNDCKTTLDIDLGLFDIPLGSKKAAIANADRHSVPSPSASVAAASPSFGLHLPFPLK